MTKFKIGQKVRIKQWFDMPQNLQDYYGTNSFDIGKVGEVIDFAGETEDINMYNILIINDNYTNLALEPELESLVRIGEQLLFWEL